MNRSAKKCLLLLAAAWMPAYLTGCIPIGAILGGALNVATAAAPIVGSALQTAGAATNNPGLALAGQITGAAGGAARPIAPAARAGGFQGGQPQLGGGGATLR